MGYTSKYMNMVLQKVLPPESRSIHEVSKDTGVSVRTIYKWIKKAKNGTLSQSNKEETVPRFKSQLEKFTLLLESKQYQDDQLGEWLRKHGLKSEHLVAWEQELTDSMNKKAVDVTTLQSDYKELQKKYKKLEREKEQTEAALKEMAALYALKKNWN